MMVSNKIISLKNIDNYLEITTNAAKYRIILLNDDIVRIRCTFDEEFQEEASYALVMTAWEDKMDDLLREERKQVEAVSSKYEDLDSSYSIIYKKFEYKYL